jgi:hypothetical protein
VLGAAADLLVVEVGGRPAWLPRARAGWLEEPLPAGHDVHLLAAFDTYLLGYRRRDLVVAPAYARRVNAGGGLIHPVLLVDGVVGGTWRSERRREGLTVEVVPFAPLPDAVGRGLQAEAADLARFLGTPAALRVGEAVPEGGPEGAAAQTKRRRSSTSATQSSQR